MEMTQNIYNGNQTSGLGGCRSNHNASGDGGKKQHEELKLLCFCTLGGGGVEQT